MVHTAHCEPERGCTCWAKWLGLSGLQQTPTDDVKEFTIDEAVMMKKAE